MDAIDIVIHGTKGGRRIFTPKIIAGLLDVTSDGAKAAAIGQEAYGIRFTAENTIFSKYKIIRDVRGDKRTGFIGFSLPIPNGKKLSGSDIVAVLDKVSKEYYKYNYIVDNNLNDVTEDWAFLTPILKEYTLSTGDKEDLQSGGKDDAFVYFEDTAKLHKYFDDPYQDEYAPFRQILFVSSDLQDKPENPLYALRHSANDDLTGKIDLDNPFYKLLFDQNAKDEVQIDVKENGSTRSNKNKIRRKSDLEITWKKDYYETETQRGKWDEISKDFINVDDVKKTVEVKKIGLQSQTKEFTISVIKDKTKETVSDAEITCKQNDAKKNILIKKGIIKFKAEDLGEKWSLSAKKGKDWFSNEREITPENESAKDITLFLIEKRKVSIELTFTGDEIDKTFNITITDEKEGYIQSELKEYCPRNDKTTICLELRKVPKKQNSFAQKAKAFLSKLATQNDAQQQQEKFQTDFWELVHKTEVATKEDFDNWFQTGSEISAQNKYKNFYEVHLKTSSKFNKMKNFLERTPVIERKKITDVETLKSKIQ